MDYLIPVAIAVMGSIVIVFLIVIFVMNFMYKKAYSETIKIIENEIDSIAEGQKSERMRSIPAAKPVYDAIDRLHSKLTNREKNRLEMLDMVNSTTSNIELEKLLDALLPKLIENTKSGWGVFYLVNNSSGTLEIKSAKGFGKNLYREFDISIGEGLIGHAALTTEIKVVSDIPDDTVFVTKTFLGKVKPKNIMLVPIANQDELLGVLALASIYAYTNEQIDLVNLTRYYIAAAIGNGIIYERTKRLTGELQFQNSLIQDLNTDLELKIAERTAFLNNILNSVGDYAICVIDINGDILSWNTGAEKLYGYKAEDVIGRHINYLYGYDEERVRFLNKRMDAVKKDGRRSEISWQKKKDGTPYLADVTDFALLGDNGELIGFASVAKDITNLDLTGLKSWVNAD